MQVRCIRSCHRHPLPRARNCMPWRPCSLGLHFRRKCHPDLHRSHKTPCNQKSNSHSRPPESHIRIPPLRSSKDYPDTHLPRHMCRRRQNPRRILHIHSWPRNGLQKYRHRHHRIAFRGRHNCRRPRQRKGCSCMHRALCIQGSMDLQSPLCSGLSMSYQRPPTPLHRKYYRSIRLLFAAYPLHLRELEF